MAEQYCSQMLDSFLKLVHHSKSSIPAFCVSHFTFSLVATLGNLLVIRALIKASTILANVRKMFISLAFLACYFPSFPCTILYETNTSDISFLVAKLASVFLICLNSSLNPIVYCWRYREIRQIVKNTVKKIICMNENMT